MAESPQVRDRYLLHVVLFMATLLSTIWAGGGMVGRGLLYERSASLGLGPLSLNLEFILDGLRLGGSLLLFLTVHEFGHYFAARRHGVSTSLPYYIPFPFNGIGTFGAVIRIREQVPSLRKLFDIGAAGPLAGFVVAVGLLLFAIATLPPPQYLLDLPHHEVLNSFIAGYGRFPDSMPTPSGEGLTLVVGQTPLFWMMTRFVEGMPPMYEMYHYPYLFAAWLGLFFTALNLLPVGQLDGGHVLYALVGSRWHGRLARGFVFLLLVSGAIGFMQESASWTDGSLIQGFLPWLGLAAILYVYLNRMLNGDLRAVGMGMTGVILLAGLARAIGGPLAEIGYSGWLIWCLLIVFLIRVDHPPVLRHEPLTRGRRLLAYAALLIFLLCFSLKPLYII